MNKPEKPAKSNSKLGLVISVLALVGLLVFLLINKTAVIDTFKGLGYNPTPAMNAVRENLSLTADGMRIFNATRPILASSEDFNHSCESHDEAVSVLGCYTNDRVYVFNVEDDRLEGIRESTSAHEFLHAVWTRLPGLEKSELVPLLESVYADHQAELKTTIESYAEDERIGELYVRSATQIKDLPETLEAHYAKYFKDQDRLVAFYDAYIAPFNELKSEIEKLKSELSGLEKEISGRTSALDQKSADFKTKVDEFNNCANTAGCFTSRWAFDSRRAELVSEQQSLNAENDAVNALIKTYNEKAETYNKNILRSSELQSLINSNSSLNALEEE